MGPPQPWTPRSGNSDDHPEPLDHIAGPNPVLHRRLVEGNADHAGGDPKRGTSAGTTCDQFRVLFRPDDVAATISRGTLD